jgi:hypothetical protein
MRLNLSQHLPNVIAVEGEVFIAFNHDDLRTQNPGDLNVHLVAGLKDDHTASRTGVRKQDGLEYFIRTVRNKELLWFHAVIRSETIT